MKALCWLSGSSLAKKSVTELMNDSSFSTLWVISTFLKDYKYRWSERGCWTAYVMGDWVTKHFQWNRKPAFNLWWDSDVAAVVTPFLSSNYIWVVLVTAGCGGYLLCPSVGYPGLTTSPVTTSNHVEFMPVRQEAEKGFKSCKFVSNMLHQRCFVTGVRQVIPLSSKSYVCS